MINNKHRMAAKNFRKIGIFIPYCQHSVSSIYGLIFKFRAVSILVLISKRGVST